MNGQEDFLKRKADFYMHPERYAVEPFRIIGNLYFIGNQDVAAYLLDTEEGVVILDTGYPTTQALIFYSIMKLGFRIEAINAIIHTHGHFDHIGGTALLKEFSHAVTYLGWRDWDMFQKQPELSLKELSGCPCFTLFRPDKLLYDGDLLKFGSVEIRVIETPGHSDGTVSLFFNIKEGEKIYRCGLMGGAGLNTLTRQMIESYGRYSAREEYLRSLELIYEEQVDINLGNHTDQNFTLDKRAKMRNGMLEGQNPFVDSQEWKRFLDGVKSRYWDMVKKEACGFCPE